MEIHVSEHEAQALHCAVCREPFAHWSAVCEDCGTRLHFGCRGLIGRCPTLGCPQAAVVRPIRPPLRAPRPLQAKDGWLTFLLRGAFGGTLLAVVLAGLIAQSITYATTCGPETRARVDMMQLANGIELYRLDCGRLPRSLGELVRAPADDHRVYKRWRGPYVTGEDEFKDPWGNRYAYRPYGGRTSELITYGADGSPGGRGQARDHVWRSGFVARNGWDGDD